MRRRLTGLGIVALAGVLVAGCGDDGGDTGAGDDPSAEFCAQAGALEQRFAALGDDAEPTPELFRDASEGFGDLADDAPEEIADDMDVLATALASFAEAFEGVDLDDPESLAALEEEAARLEAESGDLEEAGDNVETYLREECGVELGGADDTGADDTGADGTGGDTTGEDTGGDTTEGGDGGDDGDGGTGSDRLDEVLEDDEG